MDSLTEDVVALVDVLDTGPVHYVGLSMGGYVGMRLAARHPERIRSLTLLNTMSRAESLRATVEYTTLAWAQQVCGLRPMRRTLEAKVFAPGFVRTGRGREVGKEWFARIVEADRTTLRRVVTGVVARADVHPLLHRITTPTLVIGADRDTATPVEESRRITTAIPGARLHVVADCGHSSVLEQPGVVNGYLADHLGSTE